MFNFIYKENLVIYEILFNNCSFQISCIKRDFLRKFPVRKWIRSILDLGIETYFEFSLISGKWLETIFRIF